MSVTSTVRNLGLRLLFGYRSLLSAPDYPRRFFHRLMEDTTVLDRTDTDAVQNLVIHINIIFNSALRTLPDVFGLSRFSLHGGLIRFPRCHARTNSQGRMRNAYRSDFRERQLQGVEVDGVVRRRVRAGGRVGLRAGRLRHDHRSRCSTRGSCRALKDEGWWGSAEGRPGAAVKRDSAGDSQGVKLAPSRALTCDGHYDRGYGCPQSATIANGAIPRRQQRRIAPDDYDRQRQDAQPVLTARRRVTTTPSRQNATLMTEEPEKVYPLGQCVDPHVRDQLQSNDDQRCGARGLRK